MGEWRNGRRFGLKIGAASVTGVEHTQTCDNTPSDLAAILAYLRQQSPDLAAVVRAWPDLPEPIRAGILAMVKATGKGR